MARTRIKLNRRGFTQLRNAPGVQADLKRRADRIADAAGEGFRSGTVREGTKGLDNRAHNVVVTETFNGRRRQAKHNVLQSALQWGRG